MGIPLMEGRDFSLADVTGAPVLLVNETLAKTFYKDRSPIGRRVKPGVGPGADVPWFTIVGVVRDVKQGGLSLSSRNRNVPVLYEIEMSLGDGLWALCETRLRVLQGAVGASARPRCRQRPSAAVTDSAPVLVHVPRAPRSRGAKDDQHSAGTPTGSSATPSQAGRAALTLSAEPESRPSA